MTYSKILREFRRKKILVIGDIILDRYIWGKVNRISPEAPVPVVEVSHENFLLGGAANVAHNIVSLGGRASLVGVAGKDRGGDIMKRMLEENGIDCGGVFWGSRPSTVKTRVIAHSQQVVRFDREDRTRMDGKMLGGILAYIGEVLAGFDAVIISDYKKGVVSAELIKRITKKTKNRNILVAVDPKVGHFHYYRHVSLITPNLNEASVASGIDIKDEASLMEAGRSLLRKISCEAVLVTRGEQGMSLFRNDMVVHIPTAAKNVYDVTGAGDTVIAAFTLAYAAGATMEEAAVVANHAAGIVVGEVGTAVVTPAQLRKSLGSDHPAKTGKIS
jgi:D-beta-D-heptose 7-phosphate kinase/D-beta-D-heptose 1-phosphate adenosyltransferase